MLLNTSHVELHTVSFIPGLSIYEITRKDMALSAISMNSALADKEFVLSLHHKLLTFCSFHRIEQNICLVGTSINKGCAVYYYSVTHGLRINR